MKAFLAAVATLSAAIASTAEAANTRRVEFGSAGDRIVGDLYLPDGRRDGDRLPVVVITGAWMTVRQQMPARYATELAERGYAALVFDFRGWGESGGARRQLEDPASKIADIKSAVRFAMTLPEADPGRIAGLGICAGSGYLTVAAGDLPEMRAIALIAPWLHDRQIVMETYGGPTGVQRLLEAADAAQSAFKETGRQAFVPAASTTRKEAIMVGVPYYTEEGRGRIPAWRNEADPAFWRGWLEFDAISAAASFQQPLLLIHSEAAAIPNGARRYFDAVKAPKQQLWLDGVTQFDFYDRAGPVSRSVDAVVGHFEATLL